MNTLLLIEDNPGDIRLTKEFLKDNHNVNEILTFNDGDQATDYLQEQVLKEEYILPSIIILDLNLPKKNGFEVLKELKQHTLLKHIPVIILTSSEDEGDIDKCYGLHANCYISKPVDFNSFSNLFNSLINFWCRVARVPKTLNTKPL